MQRLGWWWNGCWGTMSRREVWLEREPDGRLIVRWHGGHWRERDGCYWTYSPTRAVAALRALLDDQTRWHETITL